MIQLQLTTEEAHHLKEEVKTRLAELDGEIYQLDSVHFKEMLKSRREFIHKFLEKLPDPEAISA